ncbi:MAG TPA: NAD-dependent epimerase/dehydratase family protein [Streptosporangiaceae bacterium]|nr:NAD-dependent epimerase/dehydratase family protein [Streptosporangiaceae bacterium]
MNQLPATHVVLGAGPVGRSVAAALANRGVTPAVVTRSGTAVPGAASAVADISDPAQAAAAVAGAQVVFQCTSPAYHQWPAKFPALQASVVDAAAAAGALLVVAENLYGYGPGTGLLTEDRPLTATTRKGAVRARLWQDLAAAHQAGRLRVVAGRASDFYGPGVGAGSVVGDRFFGALLRGKPAEVLGDPDRLHTYTYIADFGEALVALSETGATWGRAWHVPSAPAVTTRSFAAQATDLAGVAVPGTGPRLRRLAPWQLRLVGLGVPAVREMPEMMYQFEQDWVVDYSAYAAAVGGRPTPMRTALAATVAAQASAAQPAAAPSGAEVPAAQGGPAA